MEKVQDVQDRSIDNRVVVVSQEFQKEANKNLEEVEDTKKSEMVTIDDKEKRREFANHKKKRDRKNDHMTKAPEEEEGQIIDIKG
ncbi:MULTISPECIES: hypothetical protein [Calditerrivibrio]|uniref:hypothetical protein n=1 Tax=Calditerrivibrio TaxID=545865 RepID=UPI003C76418F